MSTSSNSSRKTTISRAGKNVDTKSTNVDYKNPRRTYRSNKSAPTKHSGSIDFFSEPASAQQATPTRPVKNLRPIHNPFPKKYPTVELGNEVLQTVADILSLEVESNQWEIRDREGDLVLVNYSDSADMKYHGFLCGIVVDIKRKVPVCASHGYVETSISNELNTTSDGRAYMVTSINDNRYKIPTKNTIIRPSVNGTILRVFKHNGVVRVSNHTNIDVGDRKWANSVPFIDMLHKVLPPKTLESLFPADVDNSPYCYVFAVASKDTVISNRYVFPKSDSMLVSLISVFQLWIPKNAEYPDEYINPAYDSHLESLQMLDIFHRPLDNNTEDEWETWEESKDLFYAPHFADVVEYTTDVNDALNRNLLYVPPALTREEAIEFLKYGFYANDAKVTNMEFTDPKMLPGESVIMITRTKRLPTNILRVHSISSKWRTDLRQGDPNIFRRLTTLSMLVHTQLAIASELEDYHNLIPAFDVRLDPNEIAKYKYKPPGRGSGVLLTLPTVKQDPNMSKDDMLRQICIAFAFSLPPSLQNEQALNLYYEFIGAREKVAQYLFDAYSKGKSDISKRAKTLTYNASDLKIVSGNPDMLENIRIVLGNEVGPSLYRLYRESEYEQ